MEGLITLRLMIDGGHLTILQEGCAKLVGIGGRFWRMSLSLLLQPIFQFETRNGKKIFVFSQQNQVVTQGNNGTKGIN